MHMIFAKQKKPLSVEPLSYKQQKTIVTARFDHE